MREILFRGKRIMNDEWVEGYYSKYSYERWRGDFICDSDFDYTVYPETVGQYTGLTDKNGKRIFEGDIIRKGFECFVVKWNGVQSRWGLFDKCDFEVTGFNKHTENYLEIIGNIHDNPELLEEAKNEQRKVITPQNTARKLAEKGYCKASEVAREIIADMREMIKGYENIDVYLDRIEKKYTEEGK